MITKKDIEKIKKYPNACKDVKGRLRVGAATGVGLDMEERTEALLKAGVDVILIDTSHGHSKNVIDAVKVLKGTFKEIDLIAGNVGTSKGARRSDECRRGRCKNRDWPGIDLYNTNGRRRRDTPNHCDNELPVWIEQNRGAAHR